MGLPSSLLALCRARFLRGIVGAAAISLAFSALCGLACGVICFMLGLTLAWRPGIDGVEFMFASVGGARKDVEVDAGCDSGALQEMRCRTLHGVEYIHRRRDINNRNGHNGHVVRIFLRRIFPLPIYGTHCELSLRWK